MNSRSCKTHVCSFCDSTDMKMIMDFGDVALAGGFLKPDQINQEKKYPLRVCFCQNCYAVQVIDKISPDVMFQNYFYFSSAISTLKNHFQSYAQEVTARFLDPKHASVLEFGCNDGVLLRPLADQGIGTIIGVDPANNIIDSISDSRITLINDFFTEEVAEKILDAYGPMDMVMANNVYAHIADIQGTTRAVEKVLGKDGIFVFEVHYLGKVLGEMQYDMIYHEHLYYYSLLSAMKHFDRYDMMVFDIKPIPIHAGSLRFYVCKKGSRHSSEVSQSVKDLEAQERLNGFDCYETFQRFSDDITAQKTELLKLLSDLKQSGHKIAGYGASGRANTMIQFCGITHDHLEYVVDDAPAKAGYYTPGSHFEIVPRQVLSNENAPSYLLVFAWSFFDEISKRNASYLENGGHMILPLPKVTIFSSNN